MTNINNSKNFVSGPVVAPNGTVHIGDTIITNIHSFNEFKILQAQFEEVDLEFKEASRELESNPKNDFFISLILKKDKKRSEIQGKIDEFKKEILKLADEFSRISIDTNRLKLARQFFAEGNFTELKGVLDPETMTRELNNLLTETKDLNIKIQKNKNDLISKSEEFLLLALVTSGNYDLPDWFEQTVTYFDLSLKAIRTLNNLHQYSVFLNKHNHLHKATLLMEEALELAINTQFDKENEEAYYENLENTLNNISVLYKNNSEFVKAERAAKEALSICAELVRINPQKFRTKEASAKVNLSNIYIIENRIDEGLTLLLEALSLLEPQEYVEISDLSKYAMTLQNIAVVYKTKHEATLSIQYFDRAIYISTLLEEKEPGSHVPFQAHAIQNKAYTLYQDNQLDEAIKQFNIAINIYRMLVKANPMTYMETLAEALTGVADAYDANDNVKDAFIKYEEADKLFRQIGIDNQYLLPSMARNLNSWGATHLEKGDKARSKDLIEESLRILRDLSHASPRLYMQDISKSLNNLALIHKHYNQYSEAKIEFEEALQIKRELAEEDATVYLPEVAVTLGNLANLISLMGNKNEAEHHYIEALEIRRKLSILNQAKFLPKVAHSAMNLAIFYTTEKPNKEKALELATEAIKAAYHFRNSLPITQYYISNSMAIITKWGVDPLAIFTDNLNH